LLFSRLPERTLDDVLGGSDPDFDGQPGVDTRPRGAGVGLGEYAFLAGGAHDDDLLDVSDEEGLDWLFGLAARHAGRPGVVQVRRELPDAGLVDLVADTLDREFDDRRGGRAARGLEQPSESRGRVDLEDAVAVLALDDVDAAVVETDDFHRLRGDVGHLHRQDGGGVLDLAAPGDVGSPVALRGVAVHRPDDAAADDVYPEVVVAGLVVLDELLQEGLSSADHRIDPVVGVELPGAAAVGTDGRLVHHLWAELPPTGVERLPGQCEQRVGDRDPRLGERRGHRRRRRVQHRPDSVERRREPERLRRLLLFRQQEAVDDHVDVRLEGHAAVSDVDDGVFGTESGRPEAEVVGRVEDGLRLLGAVETENSDGGGG
jgi:hypothetical protein